MRWYGVDISRVPNCNLCGQPTLSYQTNNGMENIQTIELPDIDSVSPQ